MGEEPVERFRPTSGAVTGVVALVLAAVVVVVGLLDRAEGFPLPVVAAALLVGVLAWAALLRPQVWATGDELVLRNMLHTSFIPLAAIERVVVRQVLAVSAGNRRYVSPAIGKPRHRSTGWGRGGASAAAPGRSGRSGRPVEAPYADFVADRIGELAASARARQGVAPRSAEQRALAAAVRRTPAWPEIVALAVTGLLLVASLAL